MRFVCVIINLIYFYKITYFWKSLNYEIISPISVRNERFIKYWLINWSNVKLKIFFNSTLNQIDAIDVWIILIENKKLSHGCSGQLKPLY